MKPFILFLHMMLVHLLVDVHWQNGALYAGKKKHILYLFIHAFTWGLGIWIVGYWLAGFALWKLAVLTVSHAISDYWKCRVQITDETFYATYIDQAIHLLSIVLMIIL